MQKVLISLFFLISTCFAQVSTTGRVVTAGEVKIAPLDCGLSSDTSLCGPVAPFPAAPSSPTLIAACDTTPGTAERITASGNYKLSANLTAATPATKCLEIDTANVVLDLAGFDISGRIYCAFNCSGHRIYSSAAGSEITTNHAASGGDAGAIRWSGQSSIQNELSHFTINNTLDPGAAAGTVVVHGDFNSAAYVGATPQILIHHMASTTPSTNVATNRFPVFNILNAVGGFWCHHNNITLSAATAAAQGCVAYATPNAKFYRNYVNMPANTSNESARAFLFDAQGAAANSADNGQVYENYVIANNNRFVRERLTFNTKVYGNTVVSITGGNRAVHTGDADSNAQHDNANFRMWDNKFVVGNTGIVFWGRNITGAYAYNNRVVCSAGVCGTGYFANAAARLGSGVSTLTLCNNQVNSSIGASGTPNTNSNAELNATIRYGDSGTAGGSGTATAITSCPE